MADPNGDINDLLNEVFEEFEASEARSRPEARAAEPGTQPGSQEAPPLPPRPFDQFAEAMHKMAEKEESLEDPKESEELLEKMLNDLNNNDGYKGMVEGMMKHLIAKDVLYEPMKEMHEKYPKWLSANKSKLPPAEYQNYVKQFGYIEQIMYIYDSQGDEGFSEVLRLMREMQECGQVPMEIVKQLAPDMEFDEEGTPKFPDLGNLPGGGQDQCSMM